MKRDLIIILMLISFLPVSLSFSQITASDFLNRTYYTEKDGLAPGVLLKVLEGPKGFIWVLTARGLSRFDGQSFVNYTDYLNGDKREKFGGLNDVLFDPMSNRIYLAGSKGIFLSDLDEVNFRPIKSLGNDFSLDLINANIILLAGRENLLVGTLKNGLLSIDLQSGNCQEMNFHSVLKSEDNPSNLNTIHSIIPDKSSDDIFWIGTGSGVVRVDKKNLSYKIIHYNESPDFNFPIVALKLIGDKLYCGTPNNRWFIYDIVNNENRWPPYLDQIKGQQFNVKNFQEVSGKIWVSTPGGVAYLDPARDELIGEWMNDFENKALYSIDLVDSRGTIWGISRNALFKYNPKVSYRFLEYELQNELRFPTWSHTVIDMGSSFYILAYNPSGIYKVNKETFKVEVLSTDLLSRNVENRYYFRDMVQMDEHRIFLIDNKRAVILDTRTDSFVASPVSLDLLKKERIYIRSVARDQDDNYWIASNFEGLYKINLEKETLDVIKEPFIGKTKREHTYIKELFIDSKNRLWMGQAATSVLDLETLELAYLNPEFDYPVNWGYGNFVEDHDGRIWTANIESGISYIDPENLQSGLHTVLKGGYFGIYKYNDSLLYTFDGEKIGLLNSRTLSHRKLEIRSPEKLSGPILDLGNGELLIGCHHGILFYDSTKLNAQNAIYQTYVIRASGNNDVLYKGYQIDKNKFHFPAGTRSVTLDLSTFGFHSLSYSRYQYKLEDSWVDIGNNNSIILTNLGQGSHSLDVRTLTDYAEPKIRKITLDIAPFWYTSNLAIICYFMLVLGLIVTFLRVNSNRRWAIAESRRLKDMEELKSRMYANISHEFRTPLTIIKGLTSRLLKKPKGKDELELIDGINQSNKQLLNLVNQMLDLSALDSGKMEVHYSNGDVIAFLEKLVSLYRSFSDSKLQTLEFKTDVNSLCMDFDSDILQKILNNLVSNAIKYTPEGGMITIEVINNDPWLKVSVLDSGIGIDPANHQAIFNRYYKIDENNNSTGTGIGLALTKELVELLGGNISVSSTEGHGSSFTLLIPIKNEADPSVITLQEPFIKEPIDLKQQLPSPAKKVQRHSVLLIEDNHDIINFLKLVLNPFYEVLIAKNGKKGLKILKGREIDLILCDIMMPEMDGLEFSERIKKDINTSHIPIVILSARSLSEDRTAAYKLGVDAYVTKPFDTEELLVIMDNLLEKQSNRKRYLSKVLSISKAENTPEDINRLDLDLVKKLQDLILMKDRKLSTSEIARELLLSRTQLHRKIKALTGRSVTSYANHIKLKRAKHLLKTTDLRVNEIAHSVGFESDSYFIRNFKKEFGQTPESFRKQTI